VRFEHVLVVGAGQKGGGIAQVAAAAGCRVSLHDAVPGAAERALGTMRKSLEKLAEKGGADPEQALGRVEVVDDLAPADLMIEAVVEDASIKEDVFRRADDLLPASAVLASNTSSIPIGTLAAATTRPDKVVGMHFFNPPPIMKLIELVRALTTSDETLDFARGFSDRIGKIPVLSKDRAGFIVNMLLIPYLNGAVRMYEEGFASKEDIDTAIQLGLSHPMGPLTLLDFIGLDTAVFVSEVLFEEFRDPDFAPPPLLRRMVQAGYMGRKSGRGFYDYSKER
jgi:3-hydroxybutyryl-CoA dehydrogenase